MTVEEFREQNTTIDDLLYIARDYGEIYDILENIILIEDIDEHIEEGIRLALGYHSWGTVRDLLNNIDIDGDFFICLDTLEYSCHENGDDVFESYLEDVINYLDEQGYFDDDDDDDDEIEQRVNDLDEFEDIVDPDTAEIIGQSIGVRLYESAGSEQSVPDEHLDIELLFS